MAKTNYYVNKFQSPQPKTLFDDGFNTRFFAEDPLFVSFSVFFDIESPLLNHAENPLRESAERYFTNNDDFIRADYVRELRHRIGVLMFEHQYFLQSLTGLNTLHSKKIGGEEIELEFETLESLDMRITKIKELIRLVTYDYDNEKQLLPDNLQWISLNVLVSDARKIDKVINGEVVEITPSLDTTVYTIKHCKFDVEAGHDYQETISNSEPEPAANSLKIVGGYSSMKKSRLGLLAALTNDVGSSIAAVRTSLRTGHRDDAVENLRKEKQIKGENENKVVANNETKAKTDAETESKSKSVSGANAVRSVEHKASIGDVLKDVGKQALKEVGDAAKRFLRDRLIELLNKGIAKSGLNNVFFRGDLAEAVNSGSVFGAIKAAVSGNALPELDADVANLILNGKTLTKTQNASLVQEILKESDKRLGNVFD